MKILLIEDDTKIVNFLQKGLQEEYYSVDTAFDGEEGVYLASVYTYDIILLDRMLPRLEGSHVCKRLRAAGDYTPVIMLTAKNEISDRVEGLDSGADDYLTKPFAFEELLARIRVQLRKPNNLDNTLQVGDLCLDTVKKVAIREEHTLKLTAKEFALLELLMRNKETVLSEEAIKNNLESFEQSSISNVVSVYIYRLRNKIDKPFEKALLHTLRGIGYTIGDHVR